MGDNGYEGRKEDAEREEDDELTSVPFVEEDDEQRRQIISESTALDEDYLEIGSSDDKETETPLEQSDINRTPNMETIDIEDESPITYEVALTDEIAEDEDIETKLDEEVQQEDEEEKDNHYTAVEEEQK